MMSKEEQQPMKACLDDSMRTNSGTEALGSPTNMNTRRRWQISDFDRLHGSIPQIWQWNWEKMWI